MAILYKLSLTGAATSVIWLGGLCHVSLATSIDTLLSGDLSQSGHKAVPVDLDVLTGKLAAQRLGERAYVPSSSIVTDGLGQSSGYGSHSVKSSGLVSPPKESRSSYAQSTTVGSAPTPLIFNPYRAVFEVPRDTSNRELPSPSEVEAIQERLRGVRPANNSNALSSSKRSVYPGITISNPSGYGADKGRFFAGASYQSRTRFSGGPNPGKIFGGGVRDGTLGVGFGIGDARKSVGLQVSYTAASFGGSRAPFSGGFNAKLHRQFGDGWSAALGSEGFLNFGRLPSGGNKVEFNDFENTYYASLTRSILLTDNLNEPFSRLTLTGGFGSGRFRSQRKIENAEPGIGAFGSVALQVVPSTSAIAEWTGQDLAMGLSIAPFPDFPIIINPAIRDIAGAGDGDPRFILGVGGSSTLIELGSLIFGAGKSSSLLEVSSLFSDLF